MVYVLSYYMKSFQEYIRNKANLYKNSKIILIISDMPNFKVFKIIKLSLIQTR